jgi:DNA modification methylase
MIVSLKEWDGKTKNVIVNAPMNDVISKLKNVGKLKIKMIVTSPPYSVGKIPSKKGTSEKRKKTVDVTYDSVEDSFTEQNYADWLKACLSVAPLVFWNVPAKQAKPFGTDVHKPFGQVIWTKAMGTIPFATKGVIYAHEFVWLLGNADELIRPVYSVWNLPAQRFSKHPAPFPVQLAAKAIDHGSKPGDLILDPFGGSGTSAAVAKAMGRDFLTCDVSSEYCSWMKARIEGTKVMATDGTK